MNNKVPQHLIDEATKRGIVPGAVIQQFTGAYVGSLFIVDPYDEWRSSEYSLSVGRANEMNLWAKHRNTWAKVITPAPAPQEEEGLKEGDACECGPAMRAAIIELADELGLSTGCRHNNAACGMAFLTHIGTYERVNYCSPVIVANMTPEEFIRRMRVTAKKPKPIKIDGHEVKYEKGQIKVGCQTIPNATVRAIAEKLID